MFPDGAAPHDALAVLHELNFDLNDADWDYVKNTERQLGSKGQYVFKVLKNTQAYYGE